MKVLHIVSSLSRNAGGPARSVQGLVAGQCAAGIDAWLMTLKNLGEPWVDGIKNYRCANCTGAWGVKSKVRKVIDECRPDIVQVHSLWQTNLHQAVSAARATSVPYVLTPRGCLDKWSLEQKWLKKKIALLTYQGYDLSRALAFHTTSDEETSQMRRLGYNQPILQFPNGVNLPSVLPPRVGFKSERRMLFLSRMHPKKGVEALVRAWAKAKMQGWVCELVYTVGSSSEAKYESEIKAMVEDYGISDQFIFTGALSDDEKWNAYRRSDCFVLPTHTENFGIVVAEALYAGLPVITTKGAPWRDLEVKKCGWWVDIPTSNDDRQLVEALKQVAFLDDSERESMGKRGRKLVEEKYTWDAVCSAMVSGYESLLCATEIL